MHELVLAQVPAEVPVQQWGLAQFSVQSMEEAEGPLQVDHGVRSAPEAKVVAHLMLALEAKDSRAQWSFRPLHALHGEESLVQHLG
ncbi:hypothetical protein RRF57_010139 [Xylaria bambusicola]|uniref:Uncharacterized protein n=1 Tax=Xylaria bambusicola TaxID=326684 RepID=A0AAN7UWT1_9PEZI